MVDPTTKDIPVFSITRRRTTLKNRFRWLAVMFAGLMLIAAGCSSSDTDSNPLIPGNNNDANFQFIEEEVVSEQAFEGIELSLDLAGELIDSIPGAAPTRKRFYAEPAIENGTLVIESYSYSFQNNWHVFQVSGYVAIDFPVDTLDLTGIDSIQIMTDGVPQQVPDDFVNSFAFNAHFDVWSRTSSDSISADHQVTATLIDTSLIGIDADLGENIHFTRSDSLGSCDVDLANTFQATDIVMDFEGSGCPQSGTIVITTAVQFDCQGNQQNPWSLSLDGVWTITGTYDGQNENFTFTDGTNVWSASEPCGGSSPISSIF
jgi:hypothetical protein